MLAIVSGTPAVSPVGGAALNERSVPMTLVLEKLTDVQDGVVEVIWQGQGARSQGRDRRHRSRQRPRAADAGALVRQGDPHPVEFINNQYKFAKSVIDVNKEIALAIAKAAAPVTDTVLNRKSATVANQAHRHSGDGHQDRSPQGFVILAVG